MAKPLVATGHFTGCFGCHMSILDIDERILDLVEIVEFDKSPINDIKRFSRPVDIGLVEGGISNDENVEFLRMFRENCKILIAWGDCAVFGGINCMRNFMSVDEVLREGYVNTPSTVNPKGVIPGQDLPALLPKAIPVDYAVKVDVHVPGCPPDADTILYVFSEILEGRMPKVPVDMMRYD